MLFLPYSAALNLVKKPYITFTVIFICVVLHQFQWNTRNAIEQQAEKYCLSTKEKTPVKQGVDVFAKSFVLCKSALIAMHGARDLRPLNKQIEDKIKGWGEYPVSALPQIVTNTNLHYAEFKTLAPQSLDKQLMYYPDESNIWRMITSSLSHADWLHAFGNLLFFFAFAVGVEGVINNKLKFSILLLSLAFICSISYTIYSSDVDRVIPTLGLSGVVMGMIGASAYLIPQARIKVLIWGFRFVRSFYIRAWILALFYIGWDTLNLYYFGNNGGVNLVAHVSGGIGGYMLVLVFFRKEKELAREELAEEIDYQVSRKKDGHSYALSSTHGREGWNERLALRKNKQEYEKYLQEIYTQVNVHKDSDAIMLILNDYERYRQDFYLLVQVFERIKAWGESRTLLCAGRCLIEILVAGSQYARAVEVVKECQQVTKDFVLADPGMSLLLVRYAVEIHEEDVAYYLLHNADKRYDACVDTTAMKIREAELCFKELSKEEQGKELIRQLLAEADGKYKAQIMALAKMMV